jgi:hypothetical protein
MQQTCKTNRLIPQRRALFFRLLFICGLNTEFMKIPNRGSMYYCGGLKRFIRVVWSERWADGRVGSRDLISRSAEWDARCKPTSIPAQYTVLPFPAQSVLTKLYGPSTEDGLA